MRTWFLALREINGRGPLEGEMSISFGVARVDASPATHLRHFDGAAGWVSDAAATEEGMSPAKAVVHVRHVKGKEEVAIWFAPRGESDTVDLYRLECSEPLFEGIEVRCYPLFDYAGSEPRTLVVHGISTD